MPWQPLAKVALFSNSSAPYSFLGVSRKSLFFSLLFQHLPREPHSPTAQLCKGCKGSIWAIDTSRRGWICRVYSVSKHMEKLKLVHDSSWQHPDLILHLILLLTYLKLTELFPWSPGGAVLPLTLLRAPGGCLEFLKHSN